MKRFIFFSILPLLCLACFAQDCTLTGSASITITRTQARVAFVLIDDGVDVNSDMSGVYDADERAAAQWFKKMYVDKGVGNFIHVNDLKTVSPNTYAVIWIMDDRYGGNDGCNRWDCLDSRYHDGNGENTVQTGIKNYVRNGGNLFVCNYATFIVNAIGRCNFDTGDCCFVFDKGPTWDNGDTWYINPNLGLNSDEMIDNSNHPIYEGLTYTMMDWKGASRKHFPLVGSGTKTNHNCFWWFGANDLGGQNAMWNDWRVKPLGHWNGNDDVLKSLAVAEWAPIHQDAGGEYRDFSGYIISVGIGAYEWAQFQWYGQSGGTQHNIYQTNIERLTQNILAYLAQQHE